MSELHVAAMTAQTVFSGVSGRELWVTLDSGAGRGLISKQSARELNADIVRADGNYMLITANGQVPSYGCPWY